MNKRRKQSQYIHPVEIGSVGFRTVHAKKGDQFVSVQGNGTNNGEPTGP